MARPKKQTVDYFPHDTDASSGRTLTIIEHKFGNEGYTFWFKLLELLGKSPGHYFDYKDDDSWEFLLTKTKIKDAETAKNILNTLATLGAIDRELYQHKVIWSQNFVDGIADVYERRTAPLPQKPVIGANNLVTVNNNPISDSRSTQTKVKETKLNNNSNSNSNLLELYEREIGELTPAVESEIRAAEKLFPSEWIRDAIKEAALAGGEKRNWRYIAGILANWKREGRRERGGFETITDFEPDPAAEEIWAKALAVLESQVTKPNFRTWLEKTRAISYEENVFAIGVPSVSNAEYLENNQRSLIERALIDAAGAELEVVIKVIRH